MHSQFIVGLVIGAVAGFYLAGELRAYAARRHAPLPDPPADAPQTWKVYSNCDGEKASRLVDRSKFVICR